MNTCKCVCKFVCLYVCMFVCLYVCMFVCLYVCKFVCVYVCMFVYLYVCMFTVFLWLMTSVNIVLVKCVVSWKKVCIITVFFNYHVWTYLSQHDCVSIRRLDVYFMYNWTIWSFKVQSIHTSVFKAKQYM